MKVSVIVPAFNASLTITECINSIVSQSYQDMEIIIVDDGSSDKTFQIASRIAKKNASIIIIRQTNQGASAARNTGIKSANGTFVMFVDADDIILPNMIETLVNYQIKYKANLVKSGLKRISANGVGAIDTCKKIYHYKSKEEIHRGFFEIFSNGLNSPVGKLYWLSIIKDQELYFDETLEISEDLHFNLRYLEIIESAVFVPDVFYQYYIFNSFTTKKYREKLFDRRKKAIIMLEEYLDRNYLNKNIIYYSYIKLVFAAAMQEIEHKTPRKIRLSQINDNLKRQEVAVSIKKCIPQERLEKILHKIIRQKNIVLIDVFARIMSIIRKCSFLHISRISV